MSGLRWRSAIWVDNKDPLEEELHSHFLIDDNLSQYPTYPNLDSDLDHITAKEKKVEINKASVKEQSCGHFVVEDQVCEDRNEHSDVFPYQMMMIIFPQLNVMNNIKKNNHVMMIY